MPITLLLDLDDTLLETNMAVFLPAYYEALAKHLSPLVPPEVMLGALRSGVQLMMQNRDASRTLQQVFEAEFYPRVGGDPDALRQAVIAFYRDVFPGLRSATRVRDGVHELVDWAAAAGHQLAIATDPLFPIAATLERVRWAGLDPKAFGIISSFESFHFSKSHPAYFAEVLGRLGWPEHPALMAGNDVERDLRPAASLGLSTFHVVGDGDGTGEQSGDLRALRKWIAANEETLKPPAIRTRESILSVLEATPAVLQGMTAGLTLDEWRHEPSPDDWAIIELVCHLRDWEREVHTQQIDALLTSESPFVARPNAAVWAKQRRYLNEAGPAAIREYAAARAASLDLLRAAPEQVWSKPARHAIFGPTDFLEVVGFMAQHDRLHLQQAWRTLHEVKAPAHRN
jgi:FMN phosphatase YigB (HAD superfamily)